MKNNRTKAIGTGPVFALLGSLFLGLFVRGPKPIRAAPPSPPSCSEGTLAAWISNYGSGGCTLSAGYTVIVGAVSSDSNVSNSQVSLAPNSTGNGVYIVSGAVAASSMATMVYASFPIEFSNLPSTYYLALGMPSSAYYTGDRHEQHKLLESWRPVFLP